MRLRAERMIEKVTHAPIVVSDQDTALKFYTEVLGFQKRADYQKAGHPRWLTVAPKGQDTEFILVRGTYRLDPRPPAGAESGGNHWVLQTVDCLKAFDTLKARGVRFKGTPDKQPWGTSAYFIDPDGNHFAMLQPAGSGKVAPRGAMISKVTHAPIVVSDQDQALRFYTQMLGFEKRADQRRSGQSRWLTVAFPGQDLELILAEGKSKVDIKAPPEAGSAGNHVGLKTNNCLADYEALKARGVNLRDAPDKQAWGTSAYFTDPDGNHFAMVQPGAIAKVFGAISRLTR